MFVSSVFYDLDTFRHMNLINIFFHLCIKGFKSTATSPKAKDRNASRNLPKRSASSVGKSSTSGMGMRSISVGMLNHAVSHSHAVRFFIF